MPLLTREEVFAQIDATLFNNTNKQVEASEVNALLKTMYDNAPVPSVGFEHYIGESFGGGVIFHLWKDAEGVEHGLIVNKSYIDMNKKWSNVTGSIIGASAQSTWDGLSNSLAIVAQSGHTESAAKTCLDYTGGGFTDWYLPAFDEVILLFKNRFHVNQTIESTGGMKINIFGSSLYCSTEINTTGWIIIFSGAGNFENASKSTYGVGNNILVYPVRKF